MASVNRTDSILPLFPFTDGEKLSILINRYKNLTGVSAADLSTRAGYTRTYIPKLIARKMLKPKQRKLVAAALEIPETVFDNDLDTRMSTLEQEVERLKEENRALDGRVRILEAENNGLRLALNN